MPGGGKSTVGRHLARSLDVPFLDSDAEIARRTGRSVRDFFEHVGEQHFRDLEQETLAAMLDSDAGVIATGGGAVLRDANRRALRSRSTVIYLRSTPEELFRRVRYDMQRPLLLVRDPMRRMRELYRERDPLYRGIAHYVIETGRPTVSSLVSMILMQLELAGQVDLARVPSPINPMGVSS